MAKFGSKKYYDEEVKHNELRMDLLTRGLAAIINENKYDSYEDIIEYVDIVCQCGNSIKFNMRRRDECKDDEEEEEEEE